ncbi:MAG: TRAM domain-containing protein, partial [Chloroflexota bacterium]
MTTLTLRLDDLAHGGDAVGHHEGQAVFVPLGIPGETVRVALEEQRGTYARGRLLEVLEPAASRVAPPCPYFGLCGGCQWQHIAYEAQLEHKRRIVADLLARLGGQPDAPVRPALGMDDPWAYRNHVQLKMDRQGRIGYYALKSHAVVPVEQCLITHPLVDELWDALEIELEDLDGIGLRAGAATGEQMVILEGHPGDLPELEVDFPVACVYLAGESLAVLAGDSHIHEALLGRRFRLSAPSFFQVNTAQAERLAEAVRTYLDLQPDEALLDAYCGVGTFALLLADAAGSVLGIESSPWAIEDA